MKLLELRKHLGMSQEAFAESIGASPSQLSYIESGQRHVPDKPSDILRICDGLPLSPHQYAALHEALRLSSGKFRLSPGAPEEQFLLLAALRDAVISEPSRAKVLQWRELLLVTAKQT